MAEMIADLLQTQPCRNQMAGAGVAKAMRTMVRNLNPQQLEATAYHMVHGTCRQRTERRSSRHEQFPPRTMRPTVLEILKNRVPNGSRESVILHPPLLRSIDRDNFVGPIQIIDTQFAHFSASQPVYGSNIRIARSRTSCGFVPPALEISR